MKPKGNDWPAVETLADQVASVPGSVVRVDILHDDWCGVFKGRRCDCEPDVKANPVKTAWSEVLP